ncbi:hypothetical protein A9179_11080 [Pseudomonas alcaligenes]|uniref:Uncharacterized protein n=1 Tax=Aquipseudomonas alcaligenes TaxID=43263 RepID=A0ABR7RZQ8_AQUAC|nr:hypothetical protein [Pseudomonas alcaligenes]MBC9250820.1 hypothetical protein [Pseudomonas alcaligenes]
MEQNNPYAAPQVVLVDAQAPRALQGWSPQQLVLLGWLNLAYLLGTLVVLGLAMVQQKSALGDWLSLAVTLLGSYLLLRLKAFLELRFAARGLRWPVWLSVVLSVLLECMQLYWGEDRLVGLNPLALSYFGLLALLGLLILWLGIVLLKVEHGYPSLRILGWLNIATGAMVASIILLVIGILPMLAAMVASALVFFHAARELRGDAVLPAGEVDERP